MVDKKHDDQLMVEVMEVPLLTRTGKVIPREECWEKGLWYGAFNLWLYKKSPVPKIIYQLRSPTIGWAPNKLDVIVAGTYTNGEDPVATIEEELAEEVGLNIKDFNYKFVGRKLNPGKGAFDNTIRNVAVDIYVAECNMDIATFKLQKREVYAVCEIEIDKLVNLFLGKGKEFVAKGYKFDGEVIDINVSKDIFPENWDPYHFKMAKILKDFIEGDNKDPIY